MEKSREIREEVFLHTSRGEKKRCQTCFTRSLSPPSVPPDSVCVCVQPDIMWSVDWLLVLQNDGQKGPFSPRQTGWDGIWKRQHCYRILSASYCFLHVPVSQSVLSLIPLSLSLSLTPVSSPHFSQSLSLYCSYTYCVLVSSYFCILTVFKRECVFTITLSSFVIVYIYVGNQCTIYSCLNSSVCNPGWHTQTQIQFSH